MAKIGHTSIRSCDEVEKYISDDCKYYYLPLFKESLVHSVINEALGCCNDVDRGDEEIINSLIKARESKHNHIKVLFDRIHNQKLEFVVKEAHKYGLGAVLQVCTSFLFDDEFFYELLTMARDREIEWVLDSCHSKMKERILAIEENASSSHLTIPIFRQMNWKSIFESNLLQKFKDIHLYFSYQFDLNSNFLSCRDAHKLVGMLRKKFPALNFLPPKGVDLWDRRARSDFDMEPYILPCFETRSENPNVKYSVVIPTFNNQNHLRVVLKHLVKQNVGLDQFEVVVVDDGGTDQTQALVMELLESLAQPMNFKYVFFKRVRKRTMGDSQYRAGISRNLGVKNTDGEILCFLDSDIIVPQDYLEKVGHALETWDAIQAKRINLSQETSHLGFDYESMNPEIDLIPDEPYWEEFIQQKDWHLMPYNWKYVCTHSFSVRKDVFWKVGGLKKNYIFYGFEDTDLGYRLVKRGFKLHLLDTKVFHMFHENTRSEFMNLKSLRHNLLSRTAQIFYLHHLDEDIFENLLGFMDPEPTFQRFLNRAVKTLSLQFVWKSRDPVYRSLNQVKVKDHELQ